MRSLFIVSLVFASVGLFPSLGSAQFNSSVFTQNYRATGGRGGQSIRSAVLSRPTTSPYLALTDLTGNGFDNATNYFTSVRPRLESQQNQQLQNRALQAVQRDVSAMRSAAAQRSQGGARATGHPTRFQFYLHYYPTLR